MEEIYAALDVSKEKIVGMWKTKEGRKISEGTFATDEKGMNLLAERLAGVTKTVTEASTTGVYVYEFLASKNLAMVMAPPSKIRLIAESDKKTDRNDAEILVDLLRTGMLPTCYVPDKDTRENRDLVRHRQTIVGIQTILKNKTRSLLSREGVICPESDILGQKALECKQRFKITQFQRFRPSPSFHPKCYILYSSFC